jgi:hypothetical protein
MTLWMILFVVQTSLVATGNRLLHMRLGKFGVVVAVFTFIVGFQLAIASGRFNPPEVRIWDLSAKQFMAVSLFTVVFFAAMVAIGLWKRRKPAIHRTFMVLSMLSVMPPILDRIDPIKNLYINTVFGPLFGPFFSTFVLGLLILIVHWALTRKIDRVYAIGYAVFFVGGFISMRLAPTAFWERISNMLAG